MEFIIFIVYDVVGDFIFFGQLIKLNISYIYLYIMRFFFGLYYFKYVWRELGEEFEQFWYEMFFQRGYIIFWDIFKCCFIENCLYNI